MTTPFLGSSYLKAGNPENRPIILIHGAGVSRTWWHLQIEELAKDFHIIAPDLPGHGALKDVSFSLASSVQTIADLIQKEKLTSAIIVGISLGGYVAMAHAKRYPQQSAGLILSGSSMNLNGFNGLSYLGVALLIKFKGTEFIEESSRKSMHKLIPEDALPGILEGGLYFRDASTIFRQLAMKNYAKMLHNYPHPVLFLNGSKDEPNRKGEDKMLAVLPNARVQIIENAGHTVNLDQPKAFNAAVYEFARNGSVS